jgi:predicted peptidase
MNNFSDKDNATLTGFKTHALSVGLVKQTMVNYPVDPSRIYITGLSMEAMEL